MDYRRDESRYTICRVAKSNNFNSNLFILKMKLKTLILICALTFLNQLRAQISDNFIEVDQEITERDDIVEVENNDSIKLFLLIEENEAPIFPGCEESEKNSIKSCFRNQLEKHIRHNLRYPISAKMNGIEGTVGVSFLITKEGNVKIVKINTPHDVLKEESKRIIQLIPVMKPGNAEGKPINVQYVTLIKYKL